MATQKIGRLILKITNVFDYLFPTQYPPNVNFIKNKTNFYIDSVEEFKYI